MNYVFLNGFLNSELQYLRHHNFKLGDSILIYQYDSTVRPGMCGLRAALYYVYFLVCCEVAGGGHR
jgi:hypothetical protein